METTMDATTMDATTMDATMDKNKNPAATSVAMLSLTDSDLLFENELLRDPYAPRAWLRYVLLKEDYLLTSVLAPARVALIYERALLTLPASYKLWKRYLDWLRTCPALLPLSRLDVRHIINAYRRALLTLHKMPRLWTDYLEFLISHAPKRKNLIRLTFDDALQALPPTQHSRIWDLLLPWAEKSAPPKHAAAIFKRYLKFDPTRLTLYIRILISLGEYTDAVTMLQRCIAQHSEDGLATYDLFEKLCEIVVEHPGTLPGAKVDLVMRAAIRHYPHNSAKFWISLARYWILHARLERARDIFEEALASISTLSDFGTIFDTYIDFLETLVSEQMKSLATDAGEHANAPDSQRLLDIDMLMHRLDHLVSQRELLVTNVLLRQSPHSVHHWLSLINQHAKSPKLAEATYRRAIDTINPRLVTGNLDQLWISYAKFQLQDSDRPALENAKNVFEEAVKVPYKSVTALANVWIAYAKMYLDERGDYLRAMELIGRATAIPSVEPASIDIKNKKLLPQRRIFKCLQLWEYYTDLEECFGTLESVRAAYECIMKLKIATPRTVVRYALYLESKDRFEDGFSVYERGIELFGWPTAYDIWNIYLPKFLARVAPSSISDIEVEVIANGKSTQTQKKRTNTDLMANVERARDLFESALEGCPEKHARSLFLVYARVEESAGLTRRAMRIYERAARTLAPSARLDVVRIYVARVIAAFGLVAARAVYERALPWVPDAAAAELCVDFGRLEVRLGEVERARAVFAHGSQFSDPRVSPEYWRMWHDFEVQFGNEDSFKEMLRIKRSVQAQFNTELNFISAQLVAAKEKQKQQALAQAQADQPQIVPSSAKPDIAAQMDETAAFEAEEAILQASTKAQAKLIAEKPVPAAVFGKSLIMAEAAHKVNKS